MANGKTHRVAAGVTVGGALALADAQAGKLTLRPIVGAGLAALLTNLPDRLEPATYPNHRQFFHSVACAAGVATCGYLLYRWQPTEDWKKAVRFALLVACAAYGVHLVLDATTPKSLPLFGKL